VFDAFSRGANALRDADVAATRRLADGLGVAVPADLAAEDLRSPDLWEAMVSPFWDEQVVAVFDYVAAGGTSGAPISQRWAYTLWTRDGRIFEFHAHLDIAAARGEARLA
jgi:hypothetical protein